MPEETQPTPTADSSDDEYFPELRELEDDQVDEFLRDRVTFTAREWAVARLCADFRTATGVEMTTVGEHLPRLVPFMDEQYSRQAVYGARHSFEEKVREAGATFLYGAYGGVLTADEVDDVVYEATEVARYLLELEGATLTHEAEAAAERRVREAMRSVHEASVDLRYDECPHCGEELDGGAA
jgi:hypothetical protein